MTDRGQTLTKLEAEVMQAVWSLPTPVRVKEVVETLNQERSRPLAYNTVQTMFTILRDKGVLEQVEGPGRAHHYRPLISREDASREVVSELVDRFFGGRLEPLLQSLVDDSTLSTDQLQALRDWVEARLSDQDGPRDGAGSSSNPADRRSVGERE